MKSIYYTPLEHRRDVYSSFYNHMLTEDIHLGIMPFGGRTKNELFKVAVKPQDAEIENLIKDSLLTHHGEPYDLKEAICDFIDEAAALLGYDGVAYYEIVYYTTSKKPTRFELHRIINRNIKDTFGLYWQYIPSAARKYIETDKKFIWLPKRRIIKIKFPSIIGGLNSQRTLIHNLTWLSECSVTPKFAMEDMKKQKQTNDYDFVVYQRNKNIFLARITQRLGWSARGELNDYTLDIYQLYRYLKFEKTKAIIRETVLGNLNKALATIGKEIGFNATIEISGIPSASDFDNYIDKLLSGEMPFAKVVEIMKYDW